MTALKSVEDILLDGSQHGKPDDPTLIVCSLYENQRPVKGAAGILDWRLRGFLSRFLAAGNITGAYNETVYVPIKRHGEMRHLLLIGLGLSTGSAAAPALIKTLSTTAGQLKFGKLAISQSDFPFFTEAKLNSALADIQWEFVQ